MRSRAAAAILAASVAVAVLWWARAVFIPGALLTIAGLLIGLAAAYALRDPAATFATQLPASVRKLRVAVEERLRDGDAPSTVSSRSRAISSARPEPPIGPRRPA